MPLTKVVGHTLIMNEKCNLFSSFIYKNFEKIGFKSCDFCFCFSSAQHGIALCVSICLFVKKQTADHGAAGRPNRILILIIESSIFRASYLR